MKTLKLEDLTKFLLNIKETDNIDYKSEFGDSKKDHAEFIKNVAAISNVGGGILIFGVDEGNSDLLGIDDINIKKYDAAQLHDKIKNHLSPTPKIEVDIIKKDNDKFPFVLIEPIDESFILISKNMGDQSKQFIREGEIYIRKGTQTILASKEEHVRKLIEKVVSERVKREVKNIESIFNNPTPRIIPVPVVEIEGLKLAEKHINIKSSTPRWEVSLISEEPEFLSIDNWKKALGSNISAETIPYPHLDLENSSKGLFKTNQGYTIYSKYADSEWNALTYCLLPSGDFFWVSTLIDSFISKLQGRKNPEKYIGIMGITRQIALIFYHAYNCYLAHMPQYSKWKGTISLKGIEGKELIPDHPELLPFFGKRICMEDEIFFDFETTPRAKSKSTELSVQAISHFFSMFNWSAGNDQASIDIRVNHIISSIQKIDYTALLR